MSAIEIRGMRKLKGEIKVQGSKNAVLPMMAGALLNHGITVIDNVPGIQDVFCMMGILNSLGCHTELSGRRLTIDASVLTGNTIAKEDMGRMRSSIMLLGVLLARAGEAGVYCPGGCMIGKRPIDLHLMALERLGARIDACNDDEFLHASAPALKGAVISFPIPSVGATENAIFAAVAAAGRTQLRNCAMEPEIEELCHFLNRMGAGIRGIGTKNLYINGGLPLHDVYYTVGGDRIVAGTYLCAAAGTGGETLITGLRAGELKSLSALLRQAGSVVYEEEDLLYLKALKPPEAVSVKTGPYPEFPTDLQPMIMVLNSLSRGTGILEETVFEDRFKTAGELIKLGAHIELRGKEAVVYGTGGLNGACVKAHDLRGGAALVCAGLAAGGLTVVEDCGYILRGYEDICRDLGGLGADIRYAATAEE